MSTNNKRIILTQECLQIILNCNTNIGWKKIADHQFRLEILKSAINAHNKTKEEEREGKKLYRKRRAEMKEE